MRERESFVEIVKERKVCERERERVGDSFYEEVRGLMCSVYVRGVMCYYEPAFFGLAVEEGIQILLLFLFL